MSRPLSASIRRANAADQAAAHGVMGSPTKPSSRLSKMFDPTERSSAPLSAVSSLDPCSSLRSFIDIASLLWRLRRASAIDTSLFYIQAEFLLSPRHEPSPGPGSPGTPPTPTHLNGHKVAPGSNGREDPPASNQEPLSKSMRPPPRPWSKSRAVAQCFLRLSHLDPTLLDHVGSYEARLWRQVAQTIWALEAMRRPPP